MEEANGVLQTQSNDLEYVLEPVLNVTQQVALMFTLPLPAQANTSLANVTLAFIVDEPEWTGLVELKVEGEAVLNSLPYTSANLISKRVRTKTSVPWIIVDKWPDVGMDVKGPDVTPIVLELISQPGWIVGNNITFIVTANGSSASMNHRTSTKEAFLAFHWCGCSSGVCCDLTTYTARPTTFVCSAGDDLCNAPANCTGYLTDCPAAQITQPVANGTTCRNNGTCQGGKCVCGPNVTDIIQVFNLGASISAEEFINGSTSLTSTDLELAYDSIQQTVGIQFALPIAKKARINNANLVFQVDENNWSGLVNLSIRGEYVGNAATLTNAAFSVTQRIVTNATVYWPITAIWNPVGAFYTSPSIIPIIEEIINHPNFVYGNTITIIISDSIVNNTNRRTATKVVSLKGDWCGAIPPPPLPYCQIPYYYFPCDPSNPVSKCVADGPDPMEPMPINLTVAFFGDQELDPAPYTSGRRVDLIRRLRDVEKVTAFFHAGDFDYISNPTAWDSMITGVLGDNFPYFSAIGNHDEPSWAVAGGYSTVILNRYKKFGAKCTGDVGRDLLCTYKGLTFITSGVGTSTTYGPNFMRTALRDYGGVWRVCMWHKNQAILQLGTKPNEVGFDAFNACNEQGAIIINGHEHSYCRSKPITYYGEPAPKYVNITPGAPLVVQPGQSFLAVAGTAGTAIRTCYAGKENNPWWGAALCAPNFTESGALVCKFNVNGVLNKANCYFIDRNGTIYDQFDVISNNPSFSCDATPPPLPPPTTPTPTPTPTPSPTPTPTPTPVPTPTDPTSATTSSSSSSSATTSTDTSSTSSVSSSTSSASTSSSLSTTSPGISGSTLFTSSLVLILGSCCILPLLLWF